MFTGHDWFNRISALLPTGITLGTALGISVAIHSVALTLNFIPPETLRRVENTLDIILVNSKSAQRPVDTQARAQVNLDGGGNTDEDRRAKTPLPPSLATHEGNDLLEAQRRLSTLETQQQMVMKQLKSDRVVATDSRRTDPTLATPDNVSSVDLASRAKAIARIEGEIARNSEEYNKRPRKKFIGARTSEYGPAMYVEGWRQKVERIGNLNYPEMAKGKLYGSLLLTVAIRSDGTLASVEINRSSGHQVLDDAARRIVQMAAPFAIFPDDLKRDYDILEITRTWSFTNADRLAAD
jgi:protein TonB